MILYMNIITILSLLGFGLVIYKMMDMNHKKVSKGASYNEKLDCSCGCGCDGKTEETKGEAEPYDSKLDDCIE